MLVATMALPLTESDLPEVFDSVESEVRSYCRGWPTVMHSATDSFRGHNPAFTTATAAIEKYWQNDEFSVATAAKGEMIRARLDDIAARYDAVSARGRGMAQGLKFEDAERAAQVCRAAFDRGALMETSGPSDEVVTLLPPLTTAQDDLETGLDIPAESIAITLN